MRLMVELAISKREDAEVLESIGDILLAKTPMVGKSDDRRFSGRARVCWACFWWRDLRRSARRATSVVAGRPMSLRNSLRKTGQRSKSGIAAQVYG